MSIFDPTTATEDEINAEYKRRWAESMAEHGVTDGWLLPREVRFTLGETLRKWWEAWTVARDSGIKKAVRQQKWQERRETFEGKFGVTDLAPPKAGARSPQEPTGTPGAASAPAAAAEPTTASTAPAASAPATTTAEPGARPAPARRPAPAPEPEPMDFGSADDVNKALKTLFGTTMEDTINND